MNENMTDENSLITPINMAEYLIEQKLYLTALEYYFEQLERGCEIELLHNLFTNPNFFENLNPNSNLDSQTIPGNYSSSSSLDSFDNGRISDDGNVMEEKLKVYEYELRKKTDELNKLRNELTSLLTSVYKNSDRNNLVNSSDNKNIEPNELLINNLNHSNMIMPHELRALNFLINQYLLQQNFRLTAIQLAEECELIGFHNLDSWDEVKINLPQPSGLIDLLKLYWYPSDKNCTQRIYDQIHNHDQTVQTEPIDFNQNITVVYENQLNQEIISKVNKNFE